MSQPEHQYFPPLLRSAGNSWASSVERKSEMIDRGIGGISFVPRGSYTPRIPSEGTRGECLFRPASPDHRQGRGSLVGGGAGGPSPAGGLRAAGGRRTPGSA